MSNPDPNNLKLDKSGWTSTRLGDLASDVNDRVANPADSDYDRFVGLEHFVSGDLKIKAWQATDGLVSAAKAFKPGDILFARRNAYLKRASMVDFGGVCSGDAFVIREDHEKLIPGFLAFVMNSRSLWRHAISNAAGTMSKRVKWRDLANYEFLLPPKDQQTKLADLLWAADGALESVQQVYQRLVRVYESRRETLCFGDTTEVETDWHRRLKREIPASADFSRLGEHLLDIRYGTSKKSNSSEQGFQCVGIPHVLDENLNSEGAAFVELSEKEHGLIKLKKNDILIVRTNGNPAYTGRSAIVNDTADLVFASYLIRVRAELDDFFPGFLIRYLQTQTARRYFKRHATSSAGNYNINTEDIKGVPVPDIPIGQQKAIANELRDLESKRNASAESVKASQALLKSLIAQIF